MKKKKKKTNALENFENWAVDDEFINLNVNSWLFERKVKINRDNPIIRMQCDSVVQLDSIIQLHE